MVKSRARLAALVLGITGFCGTSARGQQYQVLHQFHPRPANPSGLIQASDGNFYGTTSQSGTEGAGSVFKMDASGTVTTLHSFSGGDGVRPLAALVEGADGNFYGTTNFGGAYGLGAVFKITPSGVFTTLHSFNGDDGKSPQFGRWIQASDGSLYGTTITGGAKKLGTIFKITPAGVFTTVYSFTGSEGSYPSAGLIRGRDGNFYGTAALGGASGRGTVFKLDASGTVTRLFSFSGSDGSYPQAELIEGSDGVFYGTTPFGGTLNNVVNRGTVFKITAAGSFTSLHSFTGIDDGADPQAGLIKGSDGNFYGTTYGATNLESSTSSAGTVFKMDSAGTLTTLHSFTGSDGARLASGVIQASDGNFYGTTNLGGAENDGTLFKMNSSGSVTTLYSFTGYDGFIPTGGLIQGSDGNFYGTTNVGGANDIGTVFKMNSVGTLTTLHSFNGTDGTFPNFCRLIEGEDGNFYGTTTAGGPAGNGFGTVFKITPAGVLTTLHFFARADGASPAAGLTRGSDGSFYGLTTFGGALDNGAVFKITASGTFTLLHSFTGTDGQFPFSTVVQGSDGSFYGTTVQGGANGAGAVFKMDSAGVVTALHSFVGSDGAQPHGGLTSGRDGNLYGTTNIGGAGFDARSGYGTAFMITPAGAFTTIHSFAGGDGSVPQGELTLGRDGNFYGTTSQGGATFDAATYQTGLGSFFKMTPAGAVTTLHSFAGNAVGDGTSPYGGPVQASDGNFYGTTGGGGHSFVGVAYQLPGPTVQIVSTVSRKTHGSARAFDVDLPLAGAPGIECRTEQPIGTHHVVFSFATPVTVSDATVTPSGTGNTAEMNGPPVLSADLKEITVNLKNVSNAQTLGIKLLNVSDGTTTNNVLIQMAVLLGDVNGNRRVDGSDLTSLRQQSLQPLTESNFRNDVNCSGRIDGRDGTEVAPEAQALRTLP